MAREYLPIYSKLNGQSGSQIVQLLLSSTSLPFGIFPSQQASDAGWLDGGLADNTPIVPLLSLGCDPIIVVHLDHRLAKWRNRGKLDHIVSGRIAKLQRKLEIWRYSEVNFRSFIRRHGSTVSSLSKSGKLDQGVAQPTTPVPRLVHIIPSRRLGGLLRGTLRFSPQRAQWLMRLGYSDARKVLLNNIGPRQLIFCTPGFIVLGLLQRLNCQDFDVLEVARRVVVTGWAGGATAEL